MSVAAMKQVLDAWQTSVYGSDSHHKAMLLAITNTVKAIEQAEKQEPVAWMWQHDETGRTGFDEMWQLETGWEKINPRLLLVCPLYTAPPKPEWVGLTDEEINEAQEVAYRSFRRYEMSTRGQLIMPADSVDWHFAQAVEAKLKEKNHG
jgi:hypothetical protein